MSPISIHLSGKQADRDEKVRKLFQQGISTAVIAQRLGVRVGAVQASLRRLGLARKPGANQQ